MRWIVLLYFITISCLSFAQPQDSLPKKEFRSLFSNNQYDSSKPYVTQLNPRAVSFVQEYVRKQGKELDRMKGWGKSYFNLYDNILRQYNIPVQMKYLSVIESHLQSNLVSWAGAVGPWQLMDYEAKRFGLKTGVWGDERTDYIKSTHVACKLMKELYAEFGDWLLVVAAYNGGAGRVRGAIKKSRSREFWDLQYFLLEETRNHVKKFIATHYIFEGGGGFTTMTASEKDNFMKESVQPKANTPIIDSNLTSVMITGRYNSVVVCSTLGLNIAEFNSNNPSFDKELSSGKLYTLRLPKDKKELFLVHKSQILMQSVQLLLNPQ